MIFHLFHTSNSPWFLVSLEPNHALARDSFPYILSTADAALFFCYNSRKPA